MENRQRTDSLTGRMAAVASPDPDGPGNPAWQNALAQLERVHAEEDARRRRN